MRKVNIPLDKLNMKIKEKYPNTKQIIKLKVGGQNNEGIFRLCTSLYPNSFSYRRKTHKLFLQHLPVNS